MASVVKPTLSAAVALAKASSLIVNSDTLRLGKTLAQFQPVLPITHLSQDPASGDHPVRVDSQDQ
jgi:hypothetical protein